MLKPFADLDVWKTIKVGKLRELLADLPADHHVTTNDVDNLSVLDKEGYQVGWIDIASEDYQTMGDLGPPTP